MAELIQSGPGRGRFAHESIDKDAFEWRVGEAKRTIRAEQFEAGRFGKANPNKNTKGTGKRRPETSNIEQYLFMKLWREDKLPPLPEELRNRY